MHFSDHLTQASHNKSPICVGLDPRVEKLPEGVSKDTDGVLAFGKGIIDAVKDVATCVKPQLAYYELLGWEGVKVFWELCTYAKEQNLIVIADGKRNDIGSTCEAYAEAYLHENSPIDALTVSPYLGSDGIQPFVERCVQNQKGIFVLVKTSNQSSGELQDLPCGDEVVHEHLAQLVDRWGAECIGESGLSCIGAVVGATYPEELKYLRSLMPHTPFLIPGYGAQGGSAADVQYGFAADPNNADRYIPTGAIINSSRGIIYASSKTDWQEAATKAVEDMRKELGRFM